MSVTIRKDSPFFWYNFSVGGRRFRGSTGRTTKAEALKVEAEERLRAESGRVDEKNWKLRHLTGTYFAHVMTGKRSEKTAEGQIKMILELIGKDTFVNKLSNPDVSTYIAKRRAKVSNTSVNRELELLRAMLKYANEAWNHPLPEINWKKLFLTEPPARDRFLSQEEYNKLLDVAHPDLKPIIIFAVGTGLRRDNIAFLTWDQIDMSAKVIQLKVKGNKRHIVHLRGDAFTVLTAMSKREGRVFATLNLRRRWEKALTDAGIKNFRFHDLRHTFASWARMAGADILDIKEALGHSDISMTMRYSHITPGSKASAFDLIPARSLARTGDK